MDCKQGRLHGPVRNLEKLKDDKMEVEMEVDAGVPQEGDSSRIRRNSILCL